MERNGGKDVAEGVGVSGFHGLPPGSSCFPIWCPEEEVGHQKRYDEVEDGDFFLVRGWGGGGGGGGREAGRGSRN